MFTVDLKSQVPQYPCANPNWGGAACCQMIMNGYPPGAASCYINQTTIWNYIQAHNKEPGYNPGPGGWDYGWYADPYAITKTLNDLCPPEYHWVDVSGFNSQGVLHTLLKYMANYGYASLICTWAHDYWTPLVYYETSDDPRQNPNATLNWIGYYWPLTSYVQYKLVDGATFMNAMAYWGAPCNIANSAGESMCGKIWNQKWIGIGEPPEQEGAIQVEKIVRSGSMLIKPDEVRKIARSFMNQQRKNPAFLSLRKLSGLSPVRPMLVRELPVARMKQEDRKNIHYYIVPFQNKYDVDAAGNALTRLSVLVNAYTGRVEEMTVFSEPVRYFSERDVMQNLARDLGLSRRELRNMDYELVIRPGQADMSPARPAWSVANGELSFYVMPDGMIQGNFEYLSFKGR
ncbi:MAG: hypothetical protein J5I98_24650 [Phaeodactylibacter sp.]|nr:hypothetical protein [Phaeodactylibacter sp.]